MMVKYIAIGAFVFLAYLAWSMVPIDRGPGVKADKAPVLVDNSKEEPFSYNEAELMPAGSVSAEVRVISKKRYFLDGMSSFSPIDVLVGWNDLSDQRNLDYLHFDLSERTFSKKPYQLPVTHKEINEQTALWHLIPSTDEIKSELGRLRDGHLLKIEGLLVNVRDKKGLKWETSKDLFDSDKPEHEIIWVTSIQLK